MQQVLAVLLLGICLAGCEVHIKIGTPAQSRSGRRHRGLHGLLNVVQASLNSGGRITTAGTDAYAGSRQMSLPYSVSGTANQWVARIGVLTLRCFYTS